VEKKEILKLSKFVCGMGLSIWLVRACSGKGGLANRILCGI
jgi:hypothetical protein